MYHFLYVARVIWHASFPPISSMTATMSWAVSRLQIGVHLTDAELHALVDRYDATGEGCIDYLDFADFVSSEV